MGSKFKLNFKKIGSDPKYIIWVVIAIGGIVTGFLTYFHLPKRVEALEENSVSCQKSVDKLANSIDAMRAIQTARMDQQDRLAEERAKHQTEMNSLLMEWIKEVKQANGSN